MTGPHTQMTQITWSWKVTGQEPVSPGPGHRRIRPGKLTVTRFIPHDDPVVIVEGPRLRGDGTPAGNWTAVRLDPDRRPGWVADLVASVIGERVAS